VAETFNADDIKENLTGLLGYAKSLYEIRSKTFDDYLQPAYYPTLNTDLKNYENVSLGEDAPEGAWIAIQRVERMKPPQPPEGTNVFLSGVPLDKPKEQPQLRTRAYGFFGLDEASDLVESGLATSDSFYFEEGVLPAQAVRVKGELHLENFLDLQQNFRKWVLGIWANWSEEQLRLEKQIQLYRKYFSIQQQLRQKGDEFELVIGQNVVVARGENQSVVRAPVIEHAVELTVDEGAGYALLISPKDVKPRVVVEPFGHENIPGSSALKGVLDSLLAKRERDESDLTILFDYEFSEHIAGSVAAVLHPEAHSSLEETSLPQAKDFPVCTDLWVMLVRPKSQQPYIEDIEDLCSQINELDEDDLPAIAISFGSKPKDEKSTDDEVDLSKLSGKGHTNPYSGSVSGGSSQVEGVSHVDAFFPLPANDEQISILQLLEGNDAVAVQGPPGTGKSHTIANIVAHYMATGRRVLISAKTAEALSGVRDQLPPPLSSLIISLVSSDADGKEQVENTVRHIAAVSQTTNKKLIKEEIVDYREKVIAAKKRVADIDAALIKYARKHLDRITYKGKTLSAVDIVRQVLSEKSEHAWFLDDLGLSEGFEPQFSNSDVSDAREIRRLLKENILHHADQLFPVTSLPDVPALKAAHERLIEGNILSGSLLSGELPEPAENIENFHASMLECSITMKKVANIRTFLNTNTNYAKIINHWFSPHSRAQEVEEITGLLLKLSEWRDEAEELTFQRVNIDAFDWKVAELAEAVKNRCDGNKNPFGIFSSLFKGKIKESYHSIRVRGQVPTSEEEWNSVYQSIQLMNKAEKLVSQWNGLCPMFSMPELNLNMNALIKSTASIEPLLELGTLGLNQWKQTLHSLKQLFPYRVNWDDLAVLGSEYERVYEAIVKWHLNEELKSHRNMPANLRKLAALGVGPIYIKLQQFIDELGRTKDTDDLGDRWRLLRTEVSHLHDMKPKLDQLVAISQKISASGAKQWASSMLENPVIGDIDPLTPSNWFDSWEHARARGFVASLPSRQVVERLAVERSNLTENSRRDFLKLIELQTTLGLTQNLTDRLSSALSRFATAFAKVGKNIMGKRSVNYWREAQEAMKECYEVIPCWIIPEAKVADHLPAKLKAFDLVIIDEASQSDVTALPVIFRGKKLLVVGDDKQVSPNPVGIKEERIQQIMDENIYNHPFRRSFHPTNSLYDLVGIMAPGRRVALREHFRCVEPIIAFCSKNFYSEPLIPLRIPSTSERLDPPLIDIFVNTGLKRLDQNENEADVIVEEVVKIVNEPKLARRSIGVISLIGQKQAEQISRKLMDEIGIEAYEQHRILCGDARFFQGQERDIVFLSMVASPQDARAQTTKSDQQRFNVAVSRARDRLVLVRSVHASDLKNPEDLKLKLIEHFKNPVEIVHDDKNLIDLCESQFERSVFQRLIDTGYRTTPQYEAGHYRIDLIVEGHADRRLAIELDGDSFHGPDKYASDQKRQADLERIGWKFWRCWASDWEKDSDYCFNELINALELNGIEPIGSDYKPSVFVRHETRGNPQQEEDFFSELEIADSLEGNENTHSDIVVESTTVEMDSVSENSLQDKEDFAGISAQTTFVEIGDEVILYYDDSPDRELDIIISPTDNDKNENIIKPGVPLAKALLGCMADDSVEVNIGGDTRVAVVKSITKAVAV